MDDIDRIRNALAGAHTIITSANEQIANDMATRTSELLVTLNNEYDDEPSSTIFIAMARSAAQLINALFQMRDDTDGGGDMRDAADAVSLAINMIISHDIEAYEERSEAHDAVSIVEEFLRRSPNG